jgi:hypothetical protein
MKPVSISTFTMPATMISTPRPISAEPNEVIYADLDHPRVLTAETRGGVLMGAFTDEQGVLAHLAPDSFRERPRSERSQGFTWYDKFLREWRIAGLPESEAKQLYLDAMMEAIYAVSGHMYVVGVPRNDDALSVRNVLDHIILAGGFSMFSEGDSMVMAPRWPVRMAKIL